MEEHIISKVLDSLVADRRRLPALFLQIGKSSPDSYQGHFQVVLASAPQEKGTKNLSLEYNYKMKFLQSNFCWRG